MSAMKSTQPALPLLDVQAFCTPSAAARRLGVDVTTVRRMLNDRRLTTYTPRHDPQERPPILLSCVEVDQMAAARQLVKGRA